MSIFLYGAAVQGIQGFIFQTDKLREIVGASELVERICTDLFAELVYGQSPDDKGSSPEKRRQKLLTNLMKDENAIMNAAGNIKYLFKSEEECKRVVRLFPKKVMEFAPGITISQSVVVMDENTKFEDAVKDLERKLRTQRNIQMRDLSIGLQGILRSRQTGLPVTHVRKSKKDEKKVEYLDSATFHKLFDENGKRKVTFTILCKKAYGPDVNLTEYMLPYEIEDITGSNDWVAVIHADGNGLGQVVQKIGTNKDIFRLFSRRLDEATTKAAVKAFEKAVLPKIPKNGMIPMRPIVLSGDDLTVICRADLAIPFTEAFLRYFEEETEKYLGNLLKRDGNYVFTDHSTQLTACAGIAFIKSSFPFHFGYRLAESLCDKAKKDTKALFGANKGNLPASCLMFHKVQDSFVADYNGIVERDLTPQPNISFAFGPYYLSTDKPQLTDTRWSIKNLFDKARVIEGEDGNAVKSGLRNWLTLLHDNPGMAKQKLIRMKDIVSDDMKKFITSITDISCVRKAKGKDEEGKEFDIAIYPVYDILAINSINNQTTRK